MVAGPPGLYLSRREEGRREEEVEERRGGERREGAGGRGRIDFKWSGGSLGGGEWSWSIRERRARLPWSMTDISVLIRSVLFKA